jgi:uncharacterized protein (DUF1800 family)
MPRKSLTLALAGLTLMATGFAAKKPKPARTAELAAPKIPQMTDGQKALHALNRLTFGPRPGDLEQVKKIGVQQWIDQQLHPESIPENPVLLEKLEPLDTLGLSTKAMLEKYPSQQMIKAMSEGRMALPEDKETRAAVQTAIERYRRRQTADAANAAVPTAPQIGEVTIGDMQTKIQTPAPPPPGGRMTPESLNDLPLTPEQKQALLRGTPEARVALVESLPGDQQIDIIEALPQPMRNRLALAGSPSLRRRIQILSAPGQVVNRDLTEGKLLRAIYSNRQLEEVLTDFWFNHFNVYLNKGADRYMVTSYERDVIRPNVLGKFKGLLLATAQSPAMLFYLDNWQSAAPETVRPFAPPKQRKTGLNENYGRELMELHTLGVDGGYTQQDVTEVARCFTGWTIRQPQQGGGFFFNPRMHDRGEKHVLGVTIPAGGGMEDGLKVLDILAKHPSTARFISKSLAIRFVADNPPDELIDRMAATFTKTDGDLREVMRTMLTSGEFWAASRFRSKLKSPLEMVVSAVRAVNGDVENPQQMANLMNTLGQPLYLKIEPTGYSNRGADWLNSASLLARMNFANSLAQGKVNGVKVDLTQFTGDAAQIEHNILLTDASAASQSAIEAGLSPDQNPVSRQPAAGPRIAGLTLGSPDFQRR